MSPTGTPVKRTSTAQSNKAALLKQVRQLHLYLGTFFAPSIIFFALSGAFQLFGLHQGHPGEPYQPPAWIAKLGSIHKNQTLAERRGPSPPAAGENRKLAQLDEAQKEPRAPVRRRLEPRRESMFTSALKWFFLGTSIGLIITTLLGVYMAFIYNRSGLLIMGLLAAGTAIPASLIALTA